MVLLISAQIGFYMASLETLLEIFIFKCTQMQLATFFNTVPQLYE